MSQKQNHIVNILSVASSIFSITGVSVVWVKERKEFTGEEIILACVLCIIFLAAATLITHFAYRFYKAYSDNMPTLSKMCIMLIYVAIIGVFGILYFNACNSWVFKKLAHLF